MGDDRMHSFLCEVLLVFLVPILLVLPLRRRQRKADTVALYYRFWSASSPTHASSADRLARAERACRLHDCTVSFPRFFIMRIGSCRSHCSTSWSYCWCRVLSVYTTCLGPFSLLMARSLSYMIRCHFPLGSTDLFSCSSSLVDGTTVTPGLCLHHRDVCRYEYGSQNCLNSVHRNI